MRLVGALGVDLGPAQSMMPAVAHDNACGYFEQTAIYEVNEELLGVFGGSWAQPPELPVGWERSPAVLELHGRCTDVLDALFPERATRRWGFKDPRAALTLPFWKSLVGEMDYIICVRDPFDVAMSLGARPEPDTIGLEESVALWLRYVRAALDNTAGCRRLILRYDDYFRDTRRQLERLASFVLGRPLGGEVERLEALIEDELWHHRGRAPERASDTVMASAAGMLFRELAGEIAVALGTTPAVRV
jgi:hypothetical protein